MRQKVDIAEVERSTKIRAKYLRALENEEFGLLPGSTFVKTFLRTYAEYLGLDAQLLVEEYRAQHEPRGEGEMAPLAPQPRRQRERERRDRRPRSGSGSPGPGTALIVIVAVILVIFAILGLTGGDTTDEPGTAQTTETTPAAEKPRPARKKRRAAPTSVTLRVAPAAATYVCLDRGAGTPITFEGVLEEPRVFRGKRVRLNAGRSSVGLTVNGKRVKVAKSGNPIGYDFTPKRTRPLPSGQRPCA